MTVISASYCIITDRAMNAPGYGNNVFDGLNAMLKRYFKEQMELIGKLTSNDTKNIGMLPSASKGVYVKFSDQCIHIFNNKDRLNGLKGSTKMQERESLFKYQSRVYSVQSNYDVDHRGMKMQWDNKMFSSLNVIKWKIISIWKKGYSKTLYLSVRSKIWSVHCCNYRNSL